MKISGKRDMLNLVNVLLVLLLIPTLSFAQNSICGKLGQTHLAYYVDVPHPQVDFISGQMVFVSSCGPKAIALSGRCYEYATVGFCNSQGLGSCFKEGNKFTQECFNSMVCLEATKAQHGMCVYEAERADATIANAPTCNSMQGEWKDHVNDEFTLQQSKGSPFVTGTAKVYGTGFFDCGIWNIAGANIGDGNLSLTATNPGPIIPEVCCASFNYTGTSACGVAFGNWENSCGFAGVWDMEKKKENPKLTSDTLKNHAYELAYTTGKGVEHVDGLYAPNYHPIPGGDNECANLHGTWIDQYGDRYDITHELGELTFSGVVHTIGNPNAPDSRKETCGVWNFSGSVLDRGALEYSATNPNWSNAEVFCAKEYKGILHSSCVAAEGFWRQTSDGINFTQGGPFFWTATGGQR